MRHKSEPFEKFKEVRQEVEKQIEKSIKVLRSDRGGEYQSGEFWVILKSMVLSHNGLLLVHLS